MLLLARGQTAYSVALLAMDRALRAIWLLSMDGAVVNSACKWMVQLSMCGFLRQTNCLHFAFGYRCGTGLFGFNCFWGTEQLLIWLLAMGRIACNFGAGEGWKCMQIGCLPWTGLLAMWMLAMDWTVAMLLLTMDGTACKGCLLAADYRLLVMDGNAFIRAACNGQDCLQCCCWQWQNCLQFNLQWQGMIAIWLLAMDGAAFNFAADNEWYSWPWMAACDGWDFAFDWWHGTEQFAILFVVCDGWNNCSCGCLRWLEWLAMLVLARVGIALALAACNGLDCWRCGSLRWTELFAMLLLTMDGTACKGRLLAIDGCLWWTEILTMGLHTMDGSAYNVAADSGQYCWRWIELLAFCVWMPDMRE